MSWPVILSGVVCVTTLALGSRRVSDCAAGRISEIALDSEEEPRPLTHWRTQFVDSGRPLCANWSFADDLPNGSYRPVPVPKNAPGAVVQKLILADFHCL